MKNYRSFILFWLSQCFSQLTSAMTAFALTLWSYEQNRMAMSVSVMSFCNYVTYIIASLFSGAIVDRHNKKTIMLVSDSIAAACTFSVFVLAANGALSVGYICFVNALIGFVNAFQQPAAAVAVGKMVPAEKLSNVSGMNSFAANIVTVLSPMIAAFIYSLGGLQLILLIDIFGFLCAFCVLTFAVDFRDEYNKNPKSFAFSEISEGFEYLKNEKKILFIMLTLAMINFFSRLTYENILSPMILSRSGSSTGVGIVNAIMGIGGIVGGIVVSFGKISKNRAKMIYIPAAMSFLFGDILMAIGRSVPIWSIAAFAASFPIPFIMAGQNIILYSVPEKMQGRIFAARNAIQFATVPIAILFGGFLADFVFEPFMRSGDPMAEALCTIVGSGEGSGMAVMFLFTGISGFVISILAYRHCDVKI